MRDVETKAQGVNKPETNLLERQSKRDLVPMHICAKPYIMSERNQSFDLERIGHNFITLTISL